MNWNQEEMMQEIIRKEKLAYAERERMVAIWKSGQQRAADKRPFAQISQFFQTLNQLRTIRIHISFETRDPCAEGTAIQ